MESKSSLKCDRALVMMQYPHMLYGTLKHLHWTLPCPLTWEPFKQTTELARLLHA